MQCSALFVVPIWGFVCTCWYLFRVWDMKSEAYHFEKSFEHSPKASKLLCYIVLTVLMWTNYISMSKDFENSIAFKASLDLVLEGDISPSGYTEPILHKRRLQLKAMLD